MPWYPLIFCVAFVLDLWLRTSFDAGQLPRSLGVATVTGLAVTAIAIALVRERQRGGALAGIVIVGIIGGDDLRIAALALLASAVLLVLLWRDRSSNALPWAGITRLANLVGIATLGVLTASAVSSALARPQLTEIAIRAEANGAGPPGTPPDIVILMLDGHGRQDLLAEHFGEDVSNFIAALGERGFDVSERSRSNYMNTRLTLTSMFNVTHVPDLGVPLGTLTEYDPAYDAALRERLEENAVFPLLRAAGYRIATVSAGFDGADIRSADDVIDGGQITELELTLVTNTLARRTLDRIDADWAADQARSRTIWNLTPANWLGTMATNRADGHPTFIFVHAPSPHRPYVFGRDGRPAANAELSLVDDRESGQSTAEHTAAQAILYADQLAYTDQLAIEAIDVLISRLPDDAVIIVMSDHGPSVHIDWRNLEKTDTRERFGTLFAARTPGWPQAFGDAPTPVNLFPTLLNHTLGLRLASQPDDSYLGIPPRQHLVNIGNPDDR